MSVLGKTILSDDEEPDIEMIEDSCNTRSISSARIERSHK
jgi:hypothetical protein